MSCCSSSSACACEEKPETKNSLHQNTNDNNNINDDFFGDDDDHNNNNGHNSIADDREMERKTLNRLMQTARNRGKMDETQRMEVEITRKGFCEGFAAGVEEGKLAIAKFVNNKK